MKPAFFKSGTKMRRLLYYSDLLKKDEVTSFKMVYSFLCENKKREKRRLIRVKDHYKCVEMAINRDRTIARYFYGILKLKNVFLDYQKDLQTIRRMATK